MSARNTNLFEAYISSSKRSLTADQFIDLARRDRDEIKSVKFVPPKIGSEGFGRFDVELSSTSYEVAFD
ncbi:Uncharacterised protein [Pseudomonas putida]|nr:Uncharacterised protein [Pseudomonas putida]CAB5577808.1 Uncharacterised protein [Pseudomonas putida]CAB5621081.1 Uncharacterised protein [Pseudomonas putida]CAB5622595.1 Uncharacterised protein [Pseudomonas putida]CAB5702354.1 Uncharacterised protein [Pseudomonas putida]